MCGGRSRYDGSGKNKIKKVGELHIFPDTIETQGKWVEGMSKDEVYKQEN